MRPLIRLILLSCLPFTLAANASLSTSVFPDPPHSSELLALNDDELNAGVVLLRRDISYESDISDWLLRGKILEKHFARYWIRNQGGAEALSHHIFFKDQKNVVLAEIAGRTISPDGSIHWVDPDKDIKQLDVTAKGRKDDLLRTVNFPRTEAGAVLDLSWHSTRKGLPALEFVSLSYAFPVREFNLTTQGNLISPVKSFLTGLDEYYWVPFFLSAPPKSGRIELSNELDMKLTANQLPVYKREPRAPPASRVQSSIGIIPRPFKKKRVPDYNFVLPQTTFPKRSKDEEKVWISGAIEALPLAEFDTLGLQNPPREGQKEIDFYFASLQDIGKRYQRFIKNRDRAESISDIEKFASTNMSFDERVDAIFYYAKNRFDLDFEGKRKKNLAKLFNENKATQTDLLNYTKYLFDQTTIRADFALLISRHSPPFLPLLRSWEPYNRLYGLYLESEDGEARFIKPNDFFTDPHAFPPSYAGSLMIRQIDSRKNRWAIQKAPQDLPYTNRVEVDIQASFPDQLHDATFEMSVEASALGSTAHSFRVYAGNGKSPQVTDSDDDKGMKYIHRWAKTWLGFSLEMENEAHRPFFEAALPVTSQPYRVSFKSMWELDIEKLGHEVLIPGLPKIDPLLNKFVAEKRTQPIWLAAGDYTFRLRWQLNHHEPYHLPESSSAVGPSGLEFDVTREWNRESNTLISTINVVQPPFIAASDYEQARVFYEQLEQEIIRVISIRPK